MPIDPDAIMEREAHRQHIVEKAVREADRILTDEFGSSIEELNWATAQVARIFHEKAVRPFLQTLSAKDMELPREMRTDYVIDKE